MTNVIERRGAIAEIRAAGRRLEGIAAVFNKEARIGSITETIMPGAFTATLKDGHDILALADHDPGRLLARTRSGTLRLAEEARGLSFSLDVPSTQVGNDMLALAERNDLGGMSFGFRVQSEKWDGTRRELRALELVEISVVSAFPAYEGTSVAARSLASPARMALRAFLGQRK